MEVVEDIYQKIHQAHKKGQLIIPSLPELAYKIREAINSNTQTAAQISRLIQLDPGLAARLLQIANSAAYAGSVPSSDCQQAIMRLGMKVTRDLVTCMVTHNVFNTTNPVIKPYLVQLWKHSAHVAAISYVLADITPGLNSDKALLAGLVHDIGVLPVLYYAADIPHFTGNKELIEQASVRLRAPLGRNILQSWQFDEDLLSIPEQAENWLRDTGKQVDYCDVVIVAQILSFSGTSCQSRVPELVQVPAFHKLTISKLGKDAATEVLEEARDDINRVMGWLKA